MHPNGEPTSDNRLSTTITLFDDQRLLGSGIDHAVTGVQGVFFIGGQDASNPLLTNSGGAGKQRRPPGGQQRSQRLYNRRQRWSRAIRRLRGPRWPSTAAI
ncbi:MAG: hypothetical protein U0992_15755 [Planctomycetaceae bacterium]